MARESVRRTFQVALLLCLVCSFVVSLAAVSLHQRQQKNENDFRTRNVLMAAFPAELVDETSFAGFYRNRGVAGLDSFFERFVEVWAVDLSTGEIVSSIDPAKYDQVKAARDPERNGALNLMAEPHRDVAGIRSREDVGLVYLVRGDEPGAGFETIVLPIRGYGLWSTLKGFLAIDVGSLAAGPSAATVRGVTYYEHSETPGLGGEVDNPAWKSKWHGKRIFDAEWAVKLKVTKAPRSVHDVDALTGATITSNGVSNMLEFWLGVDGYGLFLKKFIAQQVTVEAAGRGGDGG